MLMPNTMARVTSLSWWNSRFVRASSSGMSRRARPSIVSPSCRKKNSKNNMIAKLSSESRAPRKNDPLTPAAVCRTCCVPATSQL